MKEVKNALLHIAPVVERGIMETTVCLAAGTKDRCYTVSPKVVVQWDSNIVYCGFKTAYKITLAGVTGDVIVNVLCRTNEGELLDDSILHISSTNYMGKVLVPFNVAAGTNIYMEIQLPEYGVVCKSACKPVHNSIPAKATYVKEKNCEIAFENRGAKIDRVDSLSQCFSRGADDQKCSLPLFINSNRKRPFFKSEKMSSSIPRSFLHVNGWAKRLLNVFVQFKICF